MGDFGCYATGDFGCNMTMMSESRITGFHGSEKGATDTESVPSVNPINKLPQVTDIITLRGIMSVVNRELIARMARMTRKIQALIARVWGEDAMVEIAA